jgi:hypothetical protein
MKLDCASVINEGHMVPTHHMHIPAHPSSHSVLNNQAGESKSCQQDDTLNEN